MKSECLFAFRSNHEGKVNFKVKPYRLAWVYIYEAHFECHDILMLGKSPIQWRQRPGKTLAVGWDLLHQIKQKQKNNTHVSEVR